MNGHGKPLPRAAAVLVLALAGCGQAGAAECSVSSSGLAFGQYRPLTLPGSVSSTTVTSDARITVVCTGIVTGGAYTIALGPSTAGNGDRISTRWLANSAGGPDMAFNIYREPNFATVWGDGLIAGQVLSGSIPPGDSSRSHNVYGRVGAGQHRLWPGSYGDTLTITVSYSP
jgi:spore coat protein U-like protein